MLTITLAVNDERIQHVEVVNSGPVGGTYAVGDGPGGDGERVYVWRCGVLAGEVRHFRRNGAAALAHQVLGDVRLAELREALAGYRKDTGAPASGADRTGRSES